MKVLLGIAVALGLAGTVVAIVALKHDDGGEYEQVTLELKGGQERGTESAAGFAEKDNPARTPAYAAEQQTTGEFRTRIRQLHSACFASPE